MIAKLVEKYKQGSITEYQLMMDCLQMLDPQAPGVVLSGLPEKVLDEMLAYARRYEPRLPRSRVHIPPAEDQVRAAEEWIMTHRASKPDHANPR